MVSFQLRFNQKLVTFKLPNTAIANDIYYQLTQEGFKVFYAAITLEDKLGQEYEPYIFAALNSAKVMLVIGTKPEYFNAVWVKNEWSRYIKLIKNDHSRLLIPCYKDMDAYDLPEEFAHLQAQDMSKIGFINDVVRSMQRLSIIETNSQQNSLNSTNTNMFNINSLLKRVQILIEDGEYTKADELCETVLNNEPENAYAYIYKLLIDFECPNLLKLEECNLEEVLSNKNYQRVKKYGDENIIKNFDRIINLYEKYKENLEIEKIEKEKRIKEQKQRIQECDCKDFEPIKPIVIDTYIIECPMCKCKQKIGRKFCYFCLQKFTEY